MGLKKSLASGQKQELKRKSLGTQSSGASWEFMGQHASDGSPEDSGGGSVMLDPLARVVGVGFVQEFLEGQLIAEERT